LREALARPVDVAGLAAFRVLFGVLVAVGAARFLFDGTLDQLYCNDAFYFRYPGVLAHVPVPSVDTIVVVYGALVALGAMIALGLLFRVASIAFTLLFTWMQLIDLTNYLNHYWLVILLGALLSIAPAHAAFSVDARLFPRVRRAHVPFVFTVLLRFQVACVYVFASLAKLGPDWLLYGQPLGLWLPARDALPLIGPFLHLPWFTLALSWCGFLYDATIVAWLSWRRTRPLAYALVIVFHGLTLAFFEIGMFPFIMAVATTAFFDPSWPRRFLRAPAAARVPAPAPAPAPAPLPHTGRALSHVATALVVAWVLVHVALPLRCHVLGDDVLWDETGMRFSWRVMVREKSGSLTYRITLPDGRVVTQSPHDLLTHRQANEMIGQPDMILQLAHHIRDVHAARGEHVEVRADALASLNGRRATRFVDPTVDLARVHDTLARPSWILPAPSAPPLQARR
jgi:vitamin K-dependent gamma-carboxylase